MNRNKKGSMTTQAKKAKVMGNKRKKAKSSSSSSGGLVAAAAAYSSSQSSGQAQIYRDSVDSCRIRHRELITSLTGSVAFTVANNFALNPGLPTSFPWLSIEAQGWEKYRFNSLKLCYYTRTGTNVPGSVILAADYDAADAAPTSEQIASAYYGTQEDAPWKNITFDFDKKRLATDRFIRVGGLAANLDVKTYDVANAFVCTTDGTAVNWGKVWIEYDIVLMNPQLPPGGPAGSGTLAGANTLTAANPFGTAPVSLGSYALSGASTNVLSFSGLSIGAEYSLNVTLAGTVITACSFTATSGVAIKSNLAVSCVNAAATNGSGAISFTASANSGTATFTVTATTVTSSQVTLSSITPAASF